MVISAPMTLMHACQRRESSLGSTIRSQKRIQFVLPSHGDAGVPLQADAVQSAEMGQVAHFVQIADVIVRQRELLEVGGEVAVALPQVDYAVALEV